MLRSLIMTVLSLVWATVLVLVGGRFLVLLFDANRSSEIVDRILRHSDFWVKPFFDMFDLANKSVGETGGVFEPASAIAFGVYFLAGLFVFAILNSAALPFSRHHPVHEG